MDYVKHFKSTAVVEQQWLTWRKSQSSSCDSEDAKNVCDVNTSHKDGSAHLFWTTCQLNFKGKAIIIVATGVFYTQRPFTVNLLALNHV